MKQRIIDKLSSYFSPQILVVSDNSADHAGHNPQAKLGGTHFNISIKSAAFEGKNMISAHRMIYACLDHEIKDGVHALEINVLSNK